MKPIRSQQDLESAIAEYASWRMVVEVTDTIGLFPGPLKGEDKAFDTRLKNRILRAGVTEQQLNQAVALLNK